MYVVQAALMRTVCEEQFLDRGRSLDLGSERCWVLVITTIMALLTTLNTSYKKYKLPNGVKIFKRPKNREDGSDFDDFWTKSIAATQPIF